MKQLGGLHTGGVRLGPAEGVEAEISGGAVRLTLHHLADRIVRERLEDANGAEEKKHLSALDGHVVGRERRDALGGTRRHPAQIDGNVAGPGEHAHAAVLQLRLAHPLEVRNLGEVERVEAL